MGHFWILFLFLLLLFGPSSHRTSSFFYLHIYYYNTSDLVCVDIVICTDNMFIRLKEVHCRRSGDP
jgi:hypothetical protein